MPVYILDILELPVEIKSAFEQGEFSIRQTSGSFNGIWSDMGTEKTIIKKYIYRHPSRVICTVSNEEIGQHF
jgi:hypothetical protein